MLRRNLQLSAYVMRDKLVEKNVVFVRQKIIEPYAASYKYLFNAPYCAQLFQ